MSQITPLLERNEAFARGTAHEGLTPLPNHQVFVLSCMDARVDPAHILGIGPGDALVMRNAGGRVTADVIEEIAFIAALTETMFGDDAPSFEVAVIHHTACGTGFLADPDFRRSFADRIGGDEAKLEAQAVTDPVAKVRVDVEHLRASPMVPDRVLISGHVYDVDTGLITTVVPA